MHYHDFVIQLGLRALNEIEVKAECPLGGDARERFALPSTPSQIASGFHAATQRGIRRDALAHPTPSAWSTAEIIGKTLFDSVFKGKVRDIFEKSTGHLAGKQDEGLRIKLKIDLSERNQIFLHSIPWELLSSDIGQFMALNKLSPIVRYLEVPQPITPHRLGPNFNLLAIAPQPKGFPRLNLEAERASLEAIQRDSPNFFVKFVTPPTLTALQAALRNSDNDAIHFMGHASLDPGTREGLVILEDSLGEPHKVSAQALTTNIGGLRGPKVIFLNACKTGAESQAIPFSGLASTLVRAGAQVVLAMQLTISDAAALVFSKTFYERLAATGSVEVALTEARLAIYNNERSSAEWPIPVLFLRASESLLFQKSPSWRAHLIARNYRHAEQEARLARAESPEDGLATTGLAIALSRGEGLGHLIFRDAIEIHRLLSEGLSKAPSRTLAAACLIALKIDYFREGGIQDRNPLLAEVLRIAAENPISLKNIELLQCLKMRDNTRAMILAIAGVR